MFSQVDGPRFGTARQPRHVLVVGAGMGGLVSALLLAAQGVRVTVVEKSARPGGKLRSLDVGGRPIDSGPTVFTMRWVFEAILDSVGERLEDHIALTRATVLARHSWEDGSVFDLESDIDRTADNVGRLAGSSDAAGYRAFCARTREVFGALDASFMRNPAPSPLGLARSAGLSGLAALTRIQPFTPLWSVIGRYFRDPRLRQLFGRYATYCGSSPFQAPGPLMLIAHVEQEGVWLVDGGMMRVALMLERLAVARGAVFRYDADAAEVMIRDGRATGVRLASGERLEVDSVVFGGDPSALFSGIAGDAARRAVPAWQPRHRSLSALTLSMLANTSGFPLSRHTVFFSDAYRSEFDDIFQRGRLPQHPTVYVCAQDRDAESGASPAGAERIFMLANAPANADINTLDEAEVAACGTRMMQRLARAGLSVDAQPRATTVTTPTDFAALFPGSGGALYGRASHGWAASFQRPGARTAIRGLYLAGGAVHPGPGVPMAAMSGSHAATAVLSDLASTASFHPMATPGGTSTRSPRTAATR